MTIGKSPRSRNRTWKDAPSTRKMADLLRQFFNFWNNDGNLAKVIKRRFLDELREYNMPVVVLVKHITVFALEVARLRNKSILHSITPLSFYYCHLWQNPPQGVEPCRPPERMTEKINIFQDLLLCQILNKNMRCLLCLPYLPLICPVRNNL